MSLPVCDASQCSKLLHTPWQSIYMACSMLIPVAISYTTYVAMQPILENEDISEGCSKEGELKRSLKSFNWSCVVASGLAVLIGGGLEINIVRLKRANVAGRIEMQQIARGRHIAFCIATGLKLAVFASIVISASVAFAAMRKCEKEARDRKKK